MIRTMNAGTLSFKQKKTQYSEEEAIEELGVTVEQFRALIRTHIAMSDEDLVHIAVATYAPSDLLVLKILAGLSGNMREAASAE
ncbi:MAG: hypothetical protein JOZ32_17325 [Bryobacterales bacterium]|nr:hypothetical protein [Bryobacterales bacterium]